MKIRAFYRPKVSFLKFQLVFTIKNLPKSSTKKFLIIYFANNIFNIYPGIKNMQTSLTRNMQERAFLSLFLATSNTKLRVATPSNTQINMKSFSFYISLFIHKSNGNIITLTRLLLGLWMILPDKFE